MARRHTREDLRFGFCDAEEEEQHLRDLKGLPDVEDNNPGMRELWRHSFYHPNVRKLGKRSFYRPSIPLSELRG